MTIKLKKLGGTSEQPYCVEIQCHWPDASMIIIHLERLPGIKVISKASSAMTDDVQVGFTYKGYPFIIPSPFSFLSISADSPDVPQQMFEEIADHINNYKTVWPHQLLAGILRHFRLPRWGR